MALKYILPRTDWGDNAVFLSRFIRRNKRFPRAYGGYIDENYKIAISGTLLEPLRQVCSDKEHAKLFIQALIGQEQTPKTYRILRNALDIDSYVPDIVPCILKPTHSCKKAYVHDEIGKELPKKMLKSWLKKNRYLSTREKNYKFLPAKLIVEELLTCNGCWPPPDCKVFCFHGEPVLIRMEIDRFKPSHTWAFHSIDWKILNIVREAPPDSPFTPLPRPKQLDRILDISRILSAPFGNGIVRVDFYVADVGLRVGELTFLPRAGKDAFQPPSVESLLGKMLRADRRDIPHLREELVGLCASHCSSNEATYPDTA